MRWPRVRTHSVDSNVSRLPKAWLCRHCERWRWAISTGWLQSRLLEMLDRGDFDLVAVGRALIANPDWPKLVRSGDTLALKPYSKDLLADLA